MPGTPIPASPLSRSRIVCGLRELADYLDRNPTVPVHEDGWDLLVFTRGETHESGRAEVDQVATALGVSAAADTPHGGLYTATKAFGPITYHFIYLNAAGHVTTHAR
jgi:hypothetical protein